MESIPNLFVIGAMKAGTSTLYRNILVNEKIERTRKKEVNFFLDDRSLAEMESLYSSQFVNKDLIRCDVSPKYSQSHVHPDVARRIARFNPTARIVYITRDPVERIISHLHHNLLRDRFKLKEVDQEVLANPDYLLTSSYFFQISKYLEHFSADQILVLQLEELKKDPALFCNRVSQFLGVPEIINREKKFNVSESRYQIKFYDFIHRNVGVSLFLKIYHYFWYFVNIRPPRPILSSDTTLQLRQTLQPDVDNLSQLFGINLQLWKNFAGREKN
jgi:hypothetical protein